MPVVSGNGASETAVAVAVADALTPAQEWLRRTRWQLVAVAAFVAYVTFMAGLNPPGGNPYWLHDDGNPVLPDRALKLYQAFWFFNTNALVASVLTVVLLLNEHFYRSEAKLTALASTTIAGLTGLFGACIVASKRDVLYSFFLIVPTCFFFGFVIYISTVLLNLKKSARKREEYAENICRSRSSGRASAV